MMHNTHWITLLDNVQSSKLWGGGLPFGWAHGQPQNNFCFTDPIGMCYTLLEPNFQGASDGTTYKPFYHTDNWKNTNLQPRV